MTLFRLDSSIRTEGSTSRAVADSAEAAWKAENPTGYVVRRDLGVEPLPATAWAASVTSGWVAADSYIFAVPLYNWGVSQYVKTWIDLVISDPRFGPGSETPPTAASSTMTR